MRLRHFVLTNFNVALPGFGADRRGETVRDAAWLDERCELFERFCLPSMRGQSDREFEWLVRWEPPADPRRAARLTDYAGQAGLRLVDASQSFRRAVAAALTPDDEAVLTTRLDNDDALHRDASARLRAAALAGPPERVFLDLPAGYQLDLAGGGLRRLWLPSNHFLSLLEPCDGGVIRTARQIAHPRAGEIAPLRAV
ncbi:MAG: putative rhamnosyl transferase, partial [Thermoanaerobaculia bacterium]|nr:putative rhamnosyl transferase [Thermoanaerobaculia bacterium]